MRLTLNTIAEFIDVHQRRDEQLKSYLISAPGRRADADGSLLRELAEGAGVSLKATNRWARQKFAEAMFSELEGFVAGHNVGRFYFLTLSPDIFALPLNHAPTFDHSRLIDWVMEQLDGLDYVAAVDFALYTNLPRAEPESAWVSFHAHAIAWGWPTKKIESLFDRLNDRYRPVVTGPTATHWRPLSQQKVASKSLYVQKAPLKEYRVVATMSDHDPVTGEIKRTPTGTYQQKKRDLRPGHAVQLCQVMRHRTMPSLLFAGRSGEQMIARASATAEHELKVRSDQLRRRREELARELSAYTARISSPR